jgi:hypothetical protein
MSERVPRRPAVFKNRWAREAGANTVPRPRCHCLDAPYVNSAWHELQVHAEVQDTECAAWQRLNQLIADAARDGRGEFSPGPEMTPEQWAQITFRRASRR